MIMADKRSYVEQSRTEWMPSDGGQASREQLSLGCLQRIATATELMARNHADLIRERDNYKRWYEGEQEQRLKLLVREAHLRGWITRLKNKRV
jgi:hypothetical protein